MTEDALVRRCTVLVEDAYAALFPDPDYELDPLPEAVEVALACFDEALELLAPRRGAGRDELFVSAREGRGTALSMLGRYEEALTVQRAIVDEPVTAEDGEVVDALVSGAWLLGELGRVDAGIVWSLRAIRTVGVDPEPSLRFRAGSARSLLEDLLRRRDGCTGEALEEALVARLDRARSAGAAFEACALHLRRARGLGADGRLVQTLEACDEVSRRVGAAHAPAMRALAVEAGLVRARTIREAGYTGAALASLAELPKCQGAEASADPVAACMVEAYELRGSLLALLGRDDDALTAHDLALEVALSVRERTYGMSVAGERARVASGVLRSVERLGLAEVLVCMQAEVLGPTHLAPVARRAHAAGWGGRATREASGLAGLPPDEAIRRSRELCDVLLREHALPRVRGDRSAARTRVALCERIVTGRVDPVAAAWVIAATDILPGSAALSGGFLRAVTGSYPGVASEAEIELEVLSRARRTLERARAGLAV